MAPPKTTTFGKFLLLLGDGADPEVFTAPCGLTSRSMNNTANTNDTVVPDCDDEDAPAWTERDVESLSSDISGSGILPAEASDVWWDWFSSGVAKNVQVKKDQAVGDGGGYWQGKAVLTQYNITAERGSKVQAEIAIQFDGKVMWTDAT